MEGNLIFLALAYTAVWAVLFGYAFLIDRRLRTARDELAAIRRQVEQGPQSH